jgi:hypothetical protein
MFTVLQKAQRRNSFLNDRPTDVSLSLILTVLHLSKNVLTSVLRIFEASQRPTVQRPDFQKQVFLRVLNHLILGWKFNART